jgi:hypothetical protein
MQIEGRDIAVGSRGLGGVGHNRTLVSMAVRNFAEIGGICHALLSDHQSADIPKFRPEDIQARIFKSGRFIPISWIAKLPGI